MKRKTRNGQPLEDQPAQPFTAPLALRKRPTLWQSYRAAPRRVHIATGGILLLVFCLIFLSIGTVVVEKIYKNSQTPTPTPISLRPHTSATASSTALLTPTAQLPPFPSTTIAIDFSLRANTSYPIASNLVGLNGLNKISTNSQLLTYLGPSHINLARVSVDMPAVFPTAASVSPQQQSWGQLDRVMAVIQAQGLQPILTIAYSPTWLQPGNNPCNGIGDPSHIYPTYMKNGTDSGLTEWGILAQQVVAHMDRAFPNIHPFYEIWNEPDGTTFLCVAANNPNADQTRLTEYAAIYAAGATRMKQQAQQDHTFIRVGGPALAVPRTRAATWLPALLNNPKTAPYMDFISYHYYHAGQQGDTWSSLLAQTQDPVNGVAGVFEHVSSIVRVGKQPGAQSTPILIDEYNTNTNLPDCCRNSQTFGSLWNALFVADLLNAVNDIKSPFGPAQAPVGGLAYFTATEPPPGNEFCLFGAWNSSMNCSMNGSIQPYPQYYAYQLLSDPRLLDITNHGFITTPPLVKAAGLVVASFYTNTKDDILIVNMGATPYSALTLGFKNPGLIQPHAFIYTLNQDNPQIGTKTLPLSAVMSGYVATITVPPYSTVALSLTV
jgi:Glycosyl hydrolases family 39